MLFALTGDSVFGRAGVIWSPGFLLLFKTTFFTLLGLARVCLALAPAEGPCPRIRDLRSRLSALLGDGLCTWLFDWITGEAGVSAALVLGFVCGLDCAAPIVSGPGCVFGKADAPGIAAARVSRLTVFPVDGVFCTGWTAGSFVTDEETA